MRRALGALALRGPDGEGLASLAGGRVALGHRRLALVDRVGGAQPLASEDGQVVAVVNGELYDEGDVLRRRLEARGHRFATGSDSELLVHLYAARGSEAVAELRGEFAFALFDARAGALWLGRDRFGVKPLVWAETAAGIVAASEAKALFELGVAPAWDGASFMHALHHQYLPPRASLFAGVQTLAPGTTLRVDLRGRRQERRYWRLPLLAGPQGTPSSSSFAERARALRAALDEAVRVRLRGDRSVAFALSGGLDSASIVALARPHLAGRRAQCFGVTFASAPYDERAAMRATARHLDVDLHEVEVGADDLLGALPDSVRGSEGLASNGQLPAKLLLARALRAAGHAVVLTGEGADEALLGYAHLRADHRGDGAAGRAQLAALLRDHPASRGLMLPAEDDARDLGALTARLGGTPGFLRAKAAVGRELAPLLAGPWRAFDPYPALVAALDAEADFAPVPSAPPIAQSAWLWTRLALAGYILRVLGDGTEMAASVEGRPPFLDTRLFEECTALPLEDKLGAGIDAQRGAPSSRPIDKAPLRAALAADLPAATLTRPKHPFLAPPLAPSVHAPRALRDFAEATALSLPFFERSAVTQWLDSAFRADASADPRGVRAPALMLLMTAGLLQRELRLAAPQERLQETWTQ
ncbi:MAG: asparagine synthase (glutamine-hydrolyzing) [Planctomycetota bacterium]